MAEAIRYRKSLPALFKAIITHGTGCPQRLFYITGVQSRGYVRLSSPKARTAIGPQLYARGDGLGSVLTWLNSAIGLHLTLLPLARVSP